MLRRIPEPAAFAFVKMGLFEINRRQAGFKIKAGADIAIQCDQIMVMESAAFLPFRHTDGLDKDRTTVAGVPVLVHLGGEALNLFKDLPAEGPLFPYLCSVRANDRATEFKSRCRQLGIVGVTLHSYRYAWAERAKTCGMPERFAQEALGHNSKAVHRAYANGL